MSGSETKQKILNAAFELIIEEPMESFSLTTIAKRVGISKPAIFRHFLNKEALLESLKVDFFYKITMVLKDIFGKDGTFYCADVFDKIACYFINNPKDLIFIVRLVLYADNVEEFFLREMKTAGMQINVKKNLYKDEQGLHIIDKNKYYQVVFHALTVVLLLKTYIEDRDLHHQKVCSPQECAQNIRLFLYKGFTGLEPVSNERFSELRNNLTFKLPEESIFSKIFKGFCLAVEKKGSLDVTVDSIAKESGMAKSSLYNYSETKDELLELLLKTELNLIRKNLSENLGFAKNNTEILFVYMYTLLGYFRNKPYSLRVFGWLRNLNILKITDFDTKDFTSFLDDFSNVQAVDMGFNISIMRWTEWLSCMPITLLIQGWQYNFSEEDIFNGIKQMISFISNGDKTIHIDFKENCSRTSVSGQI